MYNIAFFFLNFLSTGAISLVFNSASFSGSLDYGLSEYGGRHPVMA